MTKAPVACATWSDLADGLARVLLCVVVVLSVLPFREARVAMGGVPAAQAIDIATAPTPRGVGEHVLAFGALGLMLAAGGVLRRGGVAAVFAGGLCSVLELAQLWVPGRHATAWDWATNWLAVLVGLMVGRQLQPILARPADRRLPVLWWLSAVAWLVGCVVCVWRAHTGYGLDPWQRDAPLTVGNEADGQRPWRGRLGDLVFFEGALPADAAAALAATPLRSAAGRAVRAGRGMIAAFDLAGDAPVGSALMLAPAVPGSAEVAAGALRVIDGEANPWQVRGDTAMLTGALAQDDAFSIEFRCALDSTAQGGPARIVTSSTDVHERNFTIGQDGAALVFRVACAKTGRRDARLAARWSPVFRRGEELHLALVYDRGTFALYRDGLPWGRRHSLRAALAGERPLTGASARSVGLLWFLPVGLAVARGWPRRRGVERWLVVAAGGGLAVLCVAMFAGDAARREPPLPLLLWIAGGAAVGELLGRRAADRAVTVSAPLG